ncbi:MAG TPA: HD domain-containing protein [Methanomicrobiales archaeon]|nr:HD domain-containing protein [Methanomicrobiales archaeon]
MPRSLTERCEGILVSEGADERLLAHCRAVRETAREWENSPLVQADLLEAGALLHDIGRTRTHTMAHAEEGADLCRSLGLSEEIARIAERHIGAGLTPDECCLYGLLPRDCMPETLEERIVANADNLVEGAEETSVYRLLEGAFALKRRYRKRMYRLYLEMEQFKE